MVASPVFMGLLFGQDKYTNPGDTFLCTFQIPILDKSDQLYKGQRCTMIHKEATCWQKDHAGL
jgi:hypothetical protein